MKVDFISRIFHHFFIVLVCHNISLTLSLVNYAEPVQISTPQSAKPPLESGETEHPIASQDISKSNIDPDLIRDVTTLRGKTAYLHCIVKLGGEEKVSWIRLKDSQLLTAGRRTYTSDARFSSRVTSGISPVLHGWALEIKYPQVADEGLYECQISSLPSKSIYFSLWVLVPEARIVEGRNISVEIGSSINLTCLIKNSPELPVYVFWHHEDRMIYSQSPRESHTYEKGDDNTAVSRLRIKDAQPSDSGNYTCSPSNADTVSTLVYVVKGEDKAMNQNIEGTATQKGLGIDINNILLLVGMLTIWFIW